MIQTIGERIAACRRAKEMTQDQLAEKLNVSPQAVSKWENNISCPDISLLPELSNVLGVTTDQLLKGEEVPAVQLIPSEQRKPFEKLLLRVRVNSADGDIAVSYTHLRGAGNPEEYRNRNMGRNRKRCGSRFQARPQRWGTGFCLEQHRRRPQCS